MIEAEIATAIASGNMKMHLENQKVYQVDTYFRFLQHFQFVKWHFIQNHTRFFGSSARLLSCEQWFQNGF